jgi:hypothetical protein
MKARIESRTPQIWLDEILLDWTAEFVTSEAGGA